MPLGTKLPACDQLVQGNTLDHAASLVYLVFKERQEHPLQRHVTAWLHMMGTAPSYAGQLEQFEGLLAWYLTVILLGYRIARSLQY